MMWEHVHEPTGGFFELYLLDYKKIYILKVRHESPVRRNEMTRKKKILEQSWSAVGRD